MRANSQQPHLHLVPSFKRQPTLRRFLISNCSTELPVVSRCFKPSVMKLMRERLNLQSQLSLGPTFDFPA